MRLLKALVTGQNKYNIHIDPYLHDIKFEEVETKHQSGGTLSTTYSITVPEYNRKNRVITASNRALSISFYYSLEELTSIEVLNNNNVIICEVSYSTGTFSMRIYEDDEVPYKFKLEDMRSPDFLFNFDIEHGFGEAVKEHIQDIDWIFSEYSTRQYLF